MVAEYMPVLRGAHGRGRGPHRSDGGAVTTHVFRLIERLVSGLDQSGAGPPCWGWTVATPTLIVTTGSADEPAWGNGESLDAGPEALGNAARALGVGAGQDHRELLAAVAGAQVARAVQGVASVWATASGTRRPADGRRCRCRP